MTKPRGKLMSTRDEAISVLGNLGKELSQQDNRATNQPMFMVMEQHPYRDHKRVVTVCFTNVAAEEYIQTHRHNLNEPFVYVASGWQNKEWCKLRELAIALYNERVQSV